eukprot:6465339-Amphidinium_carterae.1
MSQSSLRGLPSCSSQPAATTHVHTWRTHIPHTLSRHHEGQSIVHVALPRYDWEVLGCVRHALWCA